jgi:hypothetical protein
MWLLNCADRYDIYQILSFICLDDEKFLQAAKEATDKAVTCGKEINLECGNYPIKIGDSTSHTSSKVSS